MKSHAVFCSHWILFLFLHTQEVKSAPVEEDTLKLIHVIFRHGNRTANGPEELYPKDPYLNKTYFPFGLGQLTNAGKKREYLIGIALRNRYSNFLGPYYYPEIIEPVSTDYNRTKMSLELVLAGLFPSKGKEIWNKLLSWQPVPYNYLPQAEDKVLMGTVCPHYLKLYDEYIQSPKLQAEFGKYKETFDYISNHTGLQVTKFKDIYNLYFGLSTEEEWGLQLPEWTKKVWPKTIIDLSIEEYFVSTGTTDLNRMASGYFLKKILEDTNQKIRNGNSKRKIYMYSAHENNIAQLLIALGVFERPHIPTYGSYVTLEIHKINHEYGIKIYYENYTSNKPQLLKIPACEVFCKIEKFASLIEEYIPSDDLCYQQ